MALIQNPLRKVLRPCKPWLKTGIPLFTVCCPKVMMASLPFAAGVAVFTQLLTDSEV
jgi:hypothetical protein